MGKCYSFPLLIWILCLLGFSFAGNSCTVGGKTTYCEHGCCGSLPNEECCPIATWIIVVSVLGGLLGAGTLVSMIVCCCMKERYQRSKLAQTTPSSVEHDVNKNTSTTVADTYRKNSFKAHSPMPLFFSRRPSKLASNHDDNSMELPPLRGITGAVLHTHGHRQRDVHAGHIETPTKHQQRNQAFEQDPPSQQQQQRRDSLQRSSATQFSSQPSPHDQQTRRPSVQLSADKRPSLTAQVLQQLEHVSSQLYQDRERLFSRPDPERELPPRSPSVQLHGDRDLYFLEKDQPQQRRVSIQVNDDPPLFNFVPRTVQDLSSPSKMRSPSVLGDHDLHVITQDYERRYTSAKSTNQDPPQQRRHSVVQLEVPEDQGPLVRSVTPDTGLRSPSVMLRGDSDLNTLTQEYEQGRASVLSNKNHPSVFTIKSRQPSRSAVPGARHVNYKQQRRLSVPGARN